MLTLRVGRVSARGQVTVQRDAKQSQYQVAKSRYNDRRRETSMPLFPEGFFERLVRSAPEAVLVLSAGQIVFANDRLEEMFGYRPPEWSAIGLERLFAPRDRALCLKMASACAAEQLRGVEPFVGLRNDGREFAAEAFLWPLDSDDRELIAVIIRDISQRPGAEATAPVRQQQQHLRRAEQMMAIGQVAAGVAHELRNPLTSIKGLVQVNLREARSQGLPQEDLATIEHEIRRMERTLQTFLDFARPPKPDRRRLDPATVVQRVFALVAGRAKKQGVSLRHSQPASPVWLDADADQLQQLLLNLVLNSLDAMPGGGVVEVELRPPKNGVFELQVRDTGPGIPPPILSKIFETFISSKETGIGLGVPVSQRIAEEHGGSLSAYNLPAGGACFVLRLPAELADAR